MTAVLAFLFSILVGSADFIGGMTSRTVNGVRVAAFVATTGLPLALAVALVAPWERVTDTDVLWSLVAGLVVSFGIGGFYVAMGTGPISVVAPLTAVTGAGVPVAYGVARGERPGPAAVVGLVIALVAVAVVAFAPGEQHPDAPMLGLPVIGLAVASGVCFGLFFVTFSRVSGAAGMWPVVIERAAAAFGLVALALLLARGAIKEMGRIFPAVIVVSTLEVVATVPLLLALQRGPVAVASVVSSLYPVTTVLLAGIVLRERLSRLQYVGVVCALLSVVLVSSG